MSAKAKPGAVKRFWDKASLAEKEGGWAVMLDGRPMRIPGGAPLLLTNLALAEAVAAEWQAAGGAKNGTLTMDEVPLTRLAGTAQDRIAPNPGPVAAELARYAETDLLCYRAEHPEPLVARQAQAWQPWLDWMERTHGVRLEPTAGILHRKQDPAVLALMSMAIQAAKQVGKYVGICGQGPSDHPALARWLVREGIDSLSLNPDSVLTTWLDLAQPQ